MKASTTNIKYKKQKWGPNMGENGFFVQSGLIQRLEGERQELQQSILFTNKHDLVCNEPPDILRSRSIQAKHLSFTPNLEFTCLWMMVNTIEFWKKQWDK